MRRSTANAIVAFGLTIATLLLMERPVRTGAMPTPPAVTAVPAAAPGSLG